MRSEEQGAQLPGRWRGREPRNAGGLKQLRGPGWRTARTAGSQSCNCRGLASARDREGKAALSSGRERGSQHPTPTPETERTKKRRVRAPSLWPLATGPRDPARRATLTTDGKFNPRWGPRTIPLCVGGASPRGQVSGIAHLRHAGAPESKQHWQADQSPLDRPLPSRTASGTVAHTASCESG